MTPSVATASDVAAGRLAPAERPLELLVLDRVGPCSDAVPTYTFSHRSTLSSSERRLPDPTKLDLECMDDAEVQVRFALRSMPWDVLAVFRAESRYIRF